MNAHVKRFLIFSLKAVILILVLDYLTGVLLEHFYNKMTVGEKARANYFIRKDRSDVWIFGSSRALYHYHSGVIEDSLHLPAYNAGRSNQTILYHTAILKAALKRHVPSIVVLDLQPDEFVKNHRKYERLRAILPYYQHDEDVRKLYDQTNPAYRYWSWSHALPYNSSLFATLYRGIVRGKDEDIHGFIGRDRIYGKPPRLVDNCDTTHVIDPVLIDTFHDFVSVCKTNNIKLIVVVSPLNIRYKCPRKEFLALEEEVKKSGVTYYNHLELISAPDKFADQTHLNMQGATEFSAIIAQLLKESEKKDEKITK